MKQSEDVRAFKNELRNYNFYKKRIKSINELIQYCFDMLGASPKGVDPSKEPTHCLPNKDVEYKIRDEIEHHEKNKRLTQMKVDRIDEILSRIETEQRKAIIDVYVNGKKMDAVANKIYQAKSTLRNHMDDSIKRALE